ncbi:hypothetical protein EJ110_NYTH44564 [Nymphaea thermarum]|nr:hypothetical protein EJ110_NYTH44564 [Nymphaea thermarum]
MKPDISYGENLASRQKHKFGRNLDLDPSQKVETINVSIAKKRVDCPKLKENIKKKKAAEEASVVSDVDRDVLAIFLGNNLQPDVWILDYGCSYHMRPHKSWFDSYTSCDNGKALMRN